MAQPLYEVDGDGFVATPHTIGPWSAEAQHGGPPCALVARAVERAVAPLALVRGAVDLLRPVPVGRLTVDVDVEPGGRRVRHATGYLRNQAGRVVLRMRALAIRVAEVEVPVAPPANVRPPELLEPYRLHFFQTEVGYHRSVEVRYAIGTWGEPHVFAWMRPTRPLIAGESLTPVQRVWVLVDSASGITASLPLSRFTFPNADLLVALHRPPEGEWIGIDAHFRAGTGGAGVVTATLHDTRGPIGGLLETLLVAPR